MKCSSAMVAARLTIGGFDLGDRKAAFDLRLELRQVVARVRRAAVEGGMLAAVDRFLGGEGLDLLGQLGRRAVAKGAHAFDEEGLADREGRRQSVVDGGGLDPPAVPQTGIEPAALELRSRGVMVRSDGVGRVVVLMCRKL